MTTNYEFDAIVVGSGFGGAVTAARLAEAGWKVLVLERGRRWLPEKMPRGADDDWFYDVDEPQKQNGWLDYRWFGDMSVVMGAGLGGGSLVYCSVSIIPPASAFEQHWPTAINYTQLLPHYETVGRMLNVQEIPPEQAPMRYAAMKKGAEVLGVPEKFRPVPLAVTFAPEWTRDQDKPYNDDKSREFTNPQGVKQGTCNHCGFCCSGCHLKAKNTLDYNYLAVAENKGARILTLHIARHVEKAREGYRVHADNLEGGQRKAVSFTARKVILSAGSLGSTEILLRSRDEQKSLPDVSAALGQGWSSNGDFLTFSTHKEEMLPTRSPSITCAIDYLQAPGYEGEKMFIEDGALGDVPVAYITKALRSAQKWGNAGWYKRLFNHGINYLRQLNTAKHTVAWFAQSVDASNGKLHLRKSLLHGGRTRLHLDWDIKPSERTFEKVNELHIKLAKANKATSITTMLSWTLFRDLTTPHPLGGCRMADSREEGVVDHRGEVYGYPGLYVADGAIIPYALGINPSRTIAALAERNVAIMLQEASGA